MFQSVGGASRFMVMPGLGIQVIAALADGVTYLLRDEFTTDAAAPLASPRTCEPGPGNWVIADTGNQLSISGSKLIVNGTPAAGTYLRGSDIYSHTAGLVIQVGLAYSSGQAALLAETNAVSGGLSQYGMQIISGTRIDCRDSSNYVAGISSATETGLRLVMRENGGFFYLSASRILWITGGRGTENRYAYLFFPATASNSQLDNASVYIAHGGWDADYVIADVHATPAVSGTDYTGQANAIIDQVVTAPASLAGEAGYWFRRQDATNGYRAYFNSAGAFLVDRYVAGTPTNVVSVAGVITGSGTRTIRTIADGTALRFYTAIGGLWTVRGAPITDSNFSSQTTITPFADGSWTGGGGSIGQLDSWPRTLSGAALAALEAV